MGSLDIHVTNSCSNVDDRNVKYEEALARMGKLVVTTRRVSAMEREPLPHDPRLRMDLSMFGIHDCSISPGWYDTISEMPSKLSENVSQQRV